MKSVPIKFDVIDLADSLASRTTARTIMLTLAASNDLTFSGGSKTVTKDVTVGSTPVSTTVSTRLSGTGDALAFFRVTVSEVGGDDLTACLVSIE
jgi:hypothetical protein